MVDCACERFLRPALELTMHAGIWIHPNVNQVTAACTKDQLADAGPLRQVEVCRLPLSRLCQMAYTLQTVLQ